MIVTNMIGIPTIVGYHGALESQADRNIKKQLEKAWAQAALSSLYIGAFMLAVVLALKVM